MLEADSAVRIRRRRKKAAVAVGAGAGAGLDHPRNRWKAPMVVQMKSLPRFAVAVERFLLRMDWLAVAAEMLGSEIMMRAVRTRVESVIAGRMEIDSERAVRRLTGVERAVRMTAEVARIGQKMAGQRSIVVERVART